MSKSETKPVNPFNGEAPATEYRRVFNIDKAGVYIIDEKPQGVDYRSGDCLGGLSMPDNITDIVTVNLTHHHYPHAQFQELVPGEFKGSRRGPSQLMTVPEFNPEYPFYYFGAIRNGKEVYDYKVVSRDNDFRFFYRALLEDIGNAWLAGNGAFRTSPARDRDGELDVAFKGGQEVSYYDFKPRRVQRWHGWIRLAGDSPGTLIQDSVQRINNYLSHHPHPIWRAVG